MELRSLRKREQKTLTKGEIRVKSKEKKFYASFIFMLLVLN